MSLVVCLGVVVSSYIAQAKITDRLKMGYFLFVAVFVILYTIFRVL